MDAVTWIILAVVVLVVIGLAVALLGRRKRAERARLADQHRTEARQELDQLSDHRLAAQDAEHRAQVARAQAEKAEREAEEAKLAEQAQAARVEDRQVAIFRLPDETSSVYALGNRCPFSGAHVMSRGIVGDAGGVPKVASPVYKQGFDLRTGVCLDDPEVSVPAYPVRVCDEGWVAVAVGV